MRDFLCSSNGEILSDSALTLAYRMLAYVIALEETSVPGGNIG